MDKLHFVSLLYYKNWNMQEPDVNSSKIIFRRSLVSLKFNKFDLYLNLSILFFHLFHIYNLAQDIWSQRDIIIKRTMYWFNVDVTPVRFLLDRQYWTFSRKPKKSPLPGVVVCYTDRN